MNSAAIVMMVLTMGIVTAFSVYFFVKVLRTPPKSDSSTQPNQQRKE